MDPIALHAAFVEVHRVHRVTGSPVSSRHRPCHQGWLIFRHLNDWKMKLQNQWSWRVCGALGLPQTNGLIHVMLIHVDVAGRILNDLFESF